MILLYVPPSDDHYTSSRRHRFSILISSHHATRRVFLRGAPPAHLSVRFRHGSRALARFIVLSPDDRLTTVVGLSAGREVFKLFWNSRARGPAERWGAAGLREASVDRAP